MPQDVCRLIYSGSTFQILPTGFQSYFDVLEAHSVLDKPALNYSQLCSLTCLAETTLSQRPLLACQVWQLHAARSTQGLGEVTPIRTTVWVRAR